MNLCLFLVSVYSVIAVVVVLAVYLTLMIKLISWGNRRQDNATIKFEAWLPQWVSQNGWQLVEYQSEKGPRPNSWFPRRGMLYIQFVVRDQQKNEYAGWASYNFNLIGNGQIDVRWESNEPSINKVAI